MKTASWFLAIPLLLAATAVPAVGSSVRDDARIFGAGAVRQAEAELNKVERDHQITTTVETVESLDGQNIGDLSLQLAERSGTHGIFILIVKKEHGISVRTSSKYSKAIDERREQKIRQAFITKFKADDYDGGLLAGAKEVDAQVSAAAPTVAPRTPVARPPGGLRPQGGFSFSSLLGLGLLIVAVLFGIRLLGSLFGGGQRGGYPGQMGRPGFGGPGYGGGGGGGGFMQSMFGGIGGALAGNWLYDQFSGRHGGSTDSSAYGGDASPTQETPDTWSGGSETSGGWGDSGGGGGGGDWGGGDGGGGGGDW